MFWTSTSRIGLFALASSLALSACSDDSSGGSQGSAEGTATETNGDGDASESGTNSQGDGDGDPGDGDPSGDGDGDSGDGDGDPGGDGDGDSGDGDGDSGDGDGDSGDGDGDSGDGDGDGVCADGCGQPNCGPCPMGTPPVDVGQYSIDPFEITNGEYAQFLDVVFDANYLAVLMPVECTAFKLDDADFEPNGWNNNLDPDLPVVEVDWCDATAYCAWAGKRLCGEIGGQPADINDHDNPQTNEWYRACTQGGIKNYPYGINYNGTNCNTADAGVGDVAPVGSFPNCEGGYPGLFDLSANVWEWTSACNDMGECRRRGGSFFSSGVTTSCTIDSVRARDFRNSNHGFRCCAD